MAATGPPAARTASVQLMPIPEQILAVERKLRAQHERGIYFPITRYGANRPAHEQEVRAAEPYFVKFPIELFGVIPGIGPRPYRRAPRPTETDLPEDIHPPGTKAPARRTTRAQDPSSERQLSADRSTWPGPITRENRLRP
jgi:hypothetical protein